MWGGEKIRSDEGGKPGLILIKREVKPQRGTPISDGEKNRTNHFGKMLGKSKGEKRTHKIRPWSEVRSQLKHGKKDVTSGKAGSGSSGRGSRLGGEGRGTSGTSLFAGHYALEGNCTPVREGNLKGSHGRGKIREK